MNSEWRLAPLLVPLLALACARGPGGPHADPSLSAVWPAPPEPPRVSLLQLVDEPRDLVVERGVWRTLRGVFAGAPTERLVNPTALAMDARLGLLIADPGVPGVHLLDWVNGRSRLLQGDDEHPLVSPVGVVVTPDGIIGVSDSARGAITLLTAEGDVVGEITDPGRLQRPAGLAFDAVANEFIVVDVLAHGLKRYTRDGQFVSSVGEQGTAPGQFNFPTHLHRAPDGRLAVTDSLNFRVQVLDADGTPLRQVGRLGDTPGSLARPKGVVFDAAGNLWVVDAQFENIQAFNDDGLLLLHLGGPGHAPGRFWLPSGLAIDAQNRLVVADTHNHRVQIFQLLAGPEGIP